VILLFNINGLLRVNSSAVIFYCFSLLFAVYWPLFPAVIFLSGNAKDEGFRGGSPIFPLFLPE
jgi:hypothetical protein